jgi:hypothetical protein
MKTVVPVERSEKLDRRRRWMHELHLRRRWRRGVTEQIGGLRLSRGTHCCDGINGLHDGKIRTTAEDLFESNVVIFILSGEIALRNSLCWACEEGKTVSGWRRFVFWLFCRIGLWSCFQLQNAAIAKHQVNYAHLSFLIWNRCAREEVHCDMTSFQLRLRNRAIGLYVTHAMCVITFPDFCSMKTDVPKDVPVWIEKDDVPGPTDGDERVKPGDRLEPDEKVQVGYCEEWYEPSPVLSCALHSIICWKRGLWRRRRHYVDESVSKALSFHSCTLPAINLLTILRIHWLGYLDLVRFVVYSVCKPNAALDCYVSMPIASM